MARHNKITYTNPVLAAYAYLLDLQSQMKNEKAMIELSIPVLEHRIKLIEDVMKIRHDHLYPRPGVEFL